MCKTFLKLTKKYKIASNSTVMIKNFTHIIHIVIELCDNNFNRYKNIY